MSKKLIAFYLPQMHETPQNDEWWGEGYTEYRAAVTAKPQFEGHEQPFIPQHFWDLSTSDAISKQVALARKYGVYGFCFYYYWFSGERVLNNPLDVFMMTQDFPFCICWANENWTRRWDGRENDVLLRQGYNPDDWQKFATDTLPILQHLAYMEIDGKKPLLVYRTEEIPNVKEWAARVKKYYADNGVNVMLIRAESFEVIDPAAHGFDAAYEFPPLFYAREEVTRTIAPSFEGRIYSYDSMVNWCKARPIPSWRVFQGVCPSWDNTPRRGARAHVMFGATVEKFKQWLIDAFSLSDIVFCNAWNEWGESATLEPDLINGLARLEAIKEVVNE